MRLNPFILFGILACLWAAPSAAGPPENAEYLEKVDSYQKAIAAAKDGREQALLHKQLGDLHAAWEEYGKAGDEYVRALALAPSAFTAQERLRMAISISWGSRYDIAVDILHSILSEDPGNRDARIHLAKVLSWSGKLREAGAEADRVLRDDSKNQDALIVKANVLRWQGHASASIPVYEDALRQGEQFDARLGLAHAYLDAGDRKGAEDSAMMLTPRYPYQERELKSLREELSKPRPAQQVRGDMRFSNYRDNDGNDVDRYATSYSFPLGDWRSRFSYVHTEARDRFRRNSADTLSGETRLQVTRQLGVGAGLGVIRYPDGDAAYFPTGHLKVDAESSLGSAGLTLSSEPFTDTAELLEKRIRIAAARAYFSRGLVERLSFYGAYGYAAYSDDNNSNDLLLSLRYALRRENPGINTGYRFRYLDFNRQSLGGYFDPEGFLSHQLYLHAAFEKKKFSGSAEVYIGRQTYTRNGDGHNETFSGGAAAIGYKLSKTTSLEVNVEGGDYALQTATGFNYLLYGVRLSGVW